MNRKKLIRFDWAMKYILRNKVNFDVLEGFISNLLKEEIKIQNILESESNQEEETRKFNRVDLMCVDSQGRQIIIEIQNQREVDYLQRLLWGASKTVVDNLELGQPYKDVVKVISISILYFPIGTESEYIYRGQTEFFGVHNKKPLTLHGKSLEATGVVPVKSNNIFPEYYLIDVERFEDIINEEIDEWVYFLKYGEIREDFKSPGILLASQRLDILSMSSSEKKAYEKYLAYLASERDILETSRKEGREEGIKEGEKKKEQEIILRLREQGFSDEQIKKIIGHYSV